MTLLSDDAEDKTKEHTDMKTAHTEQRINAMALQSKSKELECKMQKLAGLKEIREKYPLMTDEQISELFPELKDFLGILT